MNTVMVQPTKGHIKEALHHMAKGIEGLDDTYKQAMERIKDQGKPTRELANRILGWIIHAKGPLSTTELQHALAVRFRTESLDTDYIPSVHVLRSVCAGLVTVDEKSGIVRLAHYTTQEYLERTQIQWFPNAETEITTTCVTYLSFSVFETGFCQSDAEFEKRLRSNPLYDYAAHNWGHHARKALTLPQKVVDFLECEAKVEASIQALMAIQPHSSYSKPFPRRMTGLHLAAYFGVAGAVEALLHKGVEIDAKNSDNQTPLWWAALNGHEAVVKLLLITGKVDVDPKDWCGQTPLSQAAKNGHEAVVKLLLITGKVDVNCKDRDGWTPLSRAAANGYEAAVKQLLANDSINPNSKDNSGWTPLWLALENEHEAVVKLLLAKDSIDPNLPNHRGQTILWWAIEKATSLLYPEDSKNLKLDDNGGWIPFPVKVLNLLLTIGNVDIKSKDAYGQTLLSWAAAMGQGAIVKVLLSKDGIDPASTNNGWRTPLSLAAERGHEPVVKMLLAIHKVDPDCKDKSGRTPLSRAAESGHENIIRLLLATERVNWDAKDSNGRTPLFYAAAYGQQAVVTLLLKKGSNADLKDNASRTPLSWAAANGHKAVVKLLQSHSNPS
jgi:ankyrin repeat protein